MVVKSTQPDPNFVKNEDVKDGFTLQPGQFLKLSHEMDPKMFVYYEVAVRFREKLYGGVPKDPNIVHAWIAKSTGFDDDLTKAAVIDTLKERGVSVDESMTYEQMTDAVKGMADRKTNGFKQDTKSGKLYIESRQVIAALKESTNILWAGERWGPTRKGPKSFMAERVYIPATKIFLLKGPTGEGEAYTEPDGVDTNVVHISGPTGPVSAFTLTEYVEGAVIKFHLKALRGQIEVERFVKLFLHIAENGLGAARSQGKGKNDVISFEEIKEEDFEKAEQDSPAT